MSTRKGGITLHLAIIFLSLIVFISAIVEMTRYEIGRIQGERALMSATQSILAGYDKGLKNEYGLFARDTQYSDLEFIADTPLTTDKDGLIQDLDYYVVGNISNNPNESHQSLVDQYLLNDNRVYMDMIKLEVSDVNATYSQRLFGDPDNEVGYIKEEILDFMDLRAPLLVLQPLIEKLEVTEKVSKTSRFVQGKNAIIEEATSIENLYLDLYKHLEGLIINTKDGSMKVSEEPYVKKIMTNGSGGAYPLNYIDDVTIMSSLNSHIISYSQTGVTLKTNLLSMNSLLKTSRELSTSYNDSEAALTKMSIGLDDYKKSYIKLKLDSKASPSEVEKILASMEDIKSDINKSKDDIKGIETQLETCEEKISQLDLRIRDSLNAYDDLGNQYLQVNQAALKDIEGLESKMGALESTIDSFLEVSHQNKADYLDSAFNVGIDELTSLKKSYGKAVDMTDPNPVENLGAMKIGLSQNIAILSGVKEEAALLEKSYEQYRRIGEDETKEFGVLWGYIDTIQAAIESAYSRDMMFDYKDYGKDEMMTIGGERQSASQFYQAMTKMVEALEVNQLFEKISPAAYEFEDTLPSRVIGNKGSLGDGKAEGRDLISENPMGIGKLNTLMTFADNGKEMIYLNEYAFGMFSAYPDKFKEASERLTLTGYDKEAHVLDAELEYIVTGKTDQLEAVKTIAGEILAIRVAFNAVHLASNASKRALIMNIATAVAGWWTMGAGAVIIATIIGLLWATAESLVDLGMLLSGHKVPLLKTSGTWYLSIEGMTDSILTKGGELLVSKGTDVVGEINASTQKVIGKVGAYLTEESQNFVTEQLNDIYQDGVQFGSALGDTLDNEIDQGIQVLIDKTYEGTTYSKETYATPGTPLYGLLSKAEKMIERELSGNRTKEWLLTSKSEIMASMGTEIEEVKNELISNTNQAIEKQMSLFEEQIKLKSNELGKKGGEVTKDFLVTSTNNLKKNIQSSLKENGIVGKSEVKGDPLSQLIPSASYEDYLRIFMLMDQKGLDQRLLRMLDVIEINMSSKKQNKNWHLSDYVVRIEGEVTYHIKYAIFDIVPLNELRQSQLGTTYAIKVKVGNRYD